jgi:hypothetical protein
VDGVQCPHHFSSPSPFPRAGRKHNPENVHALRYIQNKGTIRGGEALTTIKKKKENKLN